MLNKDIHNIFEKYVNVFEAYSKPLGSLIGAQGGGEGGNWGGSLPKLISILPMGNWQPTSLKRSRMTTRSGYVSDHYIGNTTAYAADFGLNVTFKGNVEAATKFAIDLARNSGATNITSWKPYEGRDFKQYTPDGFRIQIIWLSNVGGNHYDHVHVGVARTSKKGVEVDSQISTPEDENVNQQPPETQEPSSTGDIVQNALAGIGDISANTMKTALGATLNQAWNAIASSAGGKKLQGL
jgi:hypothetical protein